MPDLKIKIALPLALFLIVSAGGLKAQSPDDTPIKVNTVLLNIPINATDKNGRYAAGLKKENFSITQEGERQGIDFFADSETPMSVAIVIDTTGSSTPVLRDIKDAVRVFLAVLRPDDEVMIVNFDHDVRLLQKLTSDQGKLKSALNHARIDEQGRTKMYDAVHQVVTEELAPAKGKKALILLTDGVEAGTKISWEKLLDTLKESDTLVYPIVFQIANRFPRNIKSVTMQQILKDPWIDLLNIMATSTGGRVYVADGINFQDAFQSIADDLKKQYIVGFYPRDGEKGKSNQITVKVDRPGIVIRTKRSIRLKTPGLEMKK